MKEEGDTITTETGEEAEAVFRRAQAGEFRIESLSVGKRQASWVFRVARPKPRQVGPMFER